MLLSTLQKSKMHKTTASVQYIVANSMKGGSTKNIGSKLVTPQLQRLNNFQLHKHIHTTSTPNTTASLHNAVLSSSPSSSSSSSLSSSSSSPSFNNQEDAIQKIMKTPAPSPVHVLKSLSRSELFSLTMIGCCTLNKPILNLVIKLFPFVPLPLIKLFIYKLYCGGDNFEQVLETGKNLQKKGINNMMLSLTIEDAEGTKNIDINHIVKETIESVYKVLQPHLEQQLSKATNATSINEIPPGYIALKPSALVTNPAQVLLNFNNMDPYWQKQRQVLIDNCSKITKVVYDLNQKLLQKYPTRKTPFFVSVIDAEKYQLQKNGVYDLQRILFQKFNPKTSPIVSCVGTWQLYLSDSAKELADEYTRAQQGNYKLGLKIVRGAYIHSEPNRSQVIHTTKQNTDENYNEVMATVIKDLVNKGQDSLYGHLVVASHNYQSQLIASQMLKNVAKENTGKCNIVFGQLLGMADNVTYDLIKNHNAKNIIKYVPWGPPLETKDYLLRRLQENGDAVRADNGWPLLKSIFKSLRE